MTLHTIQQAVLLRADVYRILAYAFDEPTPTNLQTLRGLCTDLCDVLQDEQKLAHGARQFRTALDAADVAALGAEYQRLFVTEMRVPICEGSYHRGDRGAVIGDIAGFHRAFHMVVPETAGPPDQLKVECGFLCWLALKEANAVDEQRDDDATITRDAARRFLEDHLLWWSEAFIARLRQTTTTSYFQALADWCETWLAQEREQFNVAPPPTPTTTPLPESESMVCPFADRCV